MKIICANWTFYGESPMMHSLLITNVAASPSKTALGQLESITSNGDNVLPILVVLFLIVIKVIDLFVKSWISTYLKKKAENFATKEDFKEILELERITTREIESIKRQIATGAWIDQRRWDLKRELYSKLLEVFHELRKTTANVATTYSLAQDKDFIERNKEFYDGQKKKQLELLDEAGRLTAVAALIVDEEAINAVEAFRQEASVLDVKSDPYRYMMGLCDSADRVYRLLLKEARQDLLGVNSVKST